MGSTAASKLTGLGDHGGVRHGKGSANRRLGAGDFDGDGEADILWRNADTGEDYILFMDGTTVQAGSNYTNAVPDMSWQIIVN